MEPVLDGPVLDGPVLDGPARSGSGVYNLTKHGVGAFSESLRQELAPEIAEMTAVPSVAA